MIVAFPTMIEALRQTISTELVSPEALARIASVTAALPACSNQITLECRLRGNEPRVDFMFSVSGALGGQHALARYIASLPPGQDTLASRLWRGTGALCAEWAQPGSFLHAHLPFIWLEFDILENPEPPPPFTFASVQPGAPRGKLLYATSREDDDVPRRLAFESLQLLRGEPFSPDVARCVRTCFEELPASACMIHVAPLACRGMDAVRLVMLLPCGEVTRYLARIGWPGALAQVEELLEDTTLFPGVVDLDLDVGASVLPRLGLSVPQLRGDQSLHGQRLFELLTSRRLCAPGKREALRSWLGEEWVRLPGHWLKTLRIQDAAVKLVMTPDAPLEAKLYPNLEHRFSLAAMWESPAGLERMDA